MKIIIVASSGISLVNFRGNLIRDIVKRGHEVFCISCENDDATRTAVERLGTQYIYIPMSRTGTNFLQDIKTTIAFWKVISNIRPEMFFAYMSKPVAYGGTVARLCKVPHINVLVNGLENAFYRTDVKSGIIRFVLKTFYGFVHRDCENVFFQNTDDKELFKKIGIVTDEQSTVLNGSGVDMEHFKGEVLPKEPIVLMVARLLWSKGIREYINAAESVKKIMPHVKFILVGGLDKNQESLNAKELQQCIKGNVIEHIGHVDDVREYIKQCSIFVLPSYHEGTPRCVLEAMATGRPIITTNAPGCRETVADGYNGYLIDVKNHEQLAEKIECLSKNAELREKMGNNSYKVCAEKYNVKLVNKVMLDKMSL